MNLWIVQTELYISVYLYIPALPSFFIASSFCFSVDVFCVVESCRVLDHWHYYINILFLHCLLPLFIGSAGHTAGPLLLANVYYSEGPRTTFIMCIGIICVCSSYSTSVLQKNDPLFSGQTETDYKIESVSKFKLRYYSTRFSHNRQVQ